jgi:endonuclease YncB( thermonuclease family)
VPILVRARLWTLLVIGILPGAGAAFGVSPAQAQERYAATVTSDVAARTLNAQVAGGSALEVQLIGIDAPEPGECVARREEAQADDSVLLLLRDRVL